MQGLVSEILAGAVGKQFHRGYIAGRIDVELDGYADSAADGGECPRRDFRHDLVEHLSLSDGAGSRLGGGFGARRICDAGESGGSGRGSRRT